MSETVPVGGGVETGAMPTSVRFIPGAPATGGGYELVPPGGGVVDETVPVGGGVETGAIPTSVRFIANAPRPGACDALVWVSDRTVLEVPPGGPAWTPLDEPPGGLAAGGAGVSARSAMPTRVCFIAGVEGEAAFMAPDDGVGRGGLSVAPQTPHVAVSGFADDPQRGQTLMAGRLLPVDSKRHGLVAKMQRLGLVNAMGQWPRCWQIE